MHHVRKWLFFFFSLLGTLSNRAIYVSPCPRSGLPHEVQREAEALGLSLTALLGSCYRWFTDCCAYGLPHVTELVEHELV